MADYNADNIELGEGTLYYRPLASVSADDYVSLGGTMGATLSYKPEYKDIFIGQVLASVKSVMTGESGSIKIKLKESTMTNFSIACGMAVEDILEYYLDNGVETPVSEKDPTSGDPVATVTGQYGKLEVGGRRSPVFFQLLYKVPQIDDPLKYFRYKMYKVRVSSGLELPHGKDEEREYEVEFNFFANENEAVGTLNKLFVIEKDR